MRDHGGLTLVVVAISLNVGLSAVAAWETGQTLPRADKLIDIAKLLNCTIEELLKKE